MQNFNVAMSQTRVFGICRLSSSCENGKKVFFRNGLNKSHVITNCLFSCTDYNSGPLSVFQLLDTLEQHPICYMQFIHTTLQFVVKYNFSQPGELTVQLYSWCCLYCFTKSAVNHVHSELSYNEFLVITISWLKQTVFHV